MYIDYGNTEWLEREKTIRLNNSYFELRPQGVLVKLAGKKFNLNWVVVGAKTAISSLFLDGTIT